MDLREHLLRQAAFSRATFGPGARTEGVVDHMRKELVEVETAENPDGRAKEWIDLVLLGLDGLWRCLVFEHGLHHEDAADTAVRWILDKQARNETRDWPDWRTADPKKAIEHVRKDEQ